ncbi:hypothetical protein E2C01_022749 [Portunus trituberculatus]|uniref:Uncharacterized protein n=1 Tax=Portunus trituberculatus TaxID=210409 RepID=A0A5B7E680_PORTR|nr:hypothetical protein [Portunus trituberculatus]
MVRICRYMRATPPSGTTDAHAGLQRKQRQGEALRALQSVRQGGGAGRGLAGRSPTPLHPVSGERCHPTPPCPALPRPSLLPTKPQGRPRSLSLHGMGQALLLRGLRPLHPPSPPGASGQCCARPLCQYSESKGQWFKSRPVTEQGAAQVKQEPTHVDRISRCTAGQTGPTRATYHPSLPFIKSSNLRRDRGRRTLESMHTSAPEYKHVDCLTTGKERQGIVDPCCKR